jgi:hypothetical protein
VLTAYFRYGYSFIPLPQNADLFLRRVSFAFHQSGSFLRPQTNSFPGSKKRSHVSLSTKRVSFLAIKILYKYLFMNDIYRRILPLEPNLIASHEAVLQSSGPFRRHIPAQLPARTTRASQTAEGDCRDRCCCGKPLSTLRIELRLRPRTSLINTSASRMSRDCNLKHERICHE